MKKITFAIFIIAGFILYSCTEEEKSERFKLLTGVVWESDSLLANGEDASDPGEMLAKFKGEARFNEDGTGVFGIYTGNWSLGYSDTEIAIISDSLPFTLTTEIRELTASSLKIDTGYPNLVNPDDPIEIHMTFIAK